MYKLLVLGSCSPDGDRLVTGDLRGDTLVPYLFITYLDYVL